MTWLDEDKRRRPGFSRNGTSTAWMGMEGQFTLTVVPALAGSWRNQWIWTVRDSHNGFMMLKDGIAPSLDEGRRACRSAAADLIGVAISKLAMTPPTL